MQHMRAVRVISAVIASTAISFLIASCSSDSSSSDTTAAPPATTVVDGTTTTTIADTADAVSTWEIVPSAKMPTETQDVPSGDNAEIYDGQYWGSVTVLRGVATPRAVASLVKLYSGEKCYEYAELTRQSLEDMCTNDYGVVDNPRAVMDIVDSAYVSLITEYGSTSWPTDSYVIAATDLHKLVNSIRVTGQPDAYDYVGYPYLFTVKDGIITRAEQVWVP